ncbi:tripartite motif-containing protein 45-like [Lytechinus variegatus]|uniref:tripartite motif-containing protein 45-like n=1 Tax=Lytechinus variegatus TaxID=7654 RepID=UPI001BB0FB57|nr:tripartite motif-containing protein 45-like [Lytechinus variegatus]
MAEKCESEKASISSPNLICPLCLDIFVEATILTSCGHTFCRRCLKKYDLTHQDLDHMICPLCREITKLSDNRVDDLRLNVSINGCVDDYHAKCGGMNAVLEMCQKCTACKSKKDAVSFCRTCTFYMCDKCLHSHQQLVVIFGDHEMVSIDDVIEGKVSIGHLFEKCSIHKPENKDMFCEDCKVHVCHKCVLVGHKAHEIKNQVDFEQELRRKVEDLAQRCADKKTELEKNIQNIEIQRHEVHTAVQTLLDDVRQSYTIKAKELEENLRNLTDQINALKHSFDDDLNVLKSKDRQRIKSICSSITLVDNDRLGHLETDTLSAHILLCEELDTMLKEVTDHTSASAITKKAKGRRFKPADDTRLDLGSIAGSDPKVEVIQCVDLRSDMHGMTRYSHNSVGIVYGLCAQGIDIIGSNGGKQQCSNIPNDGRYNDLVYQQDGSLCASLCDTNEAYIYSTLGSRKATIRVRDGTNDLNVNRSQSDEIIITCDDAQVYIYDPTGSTLKHTFQTKHMTYQASTTRTGLIVTSSCSANPSVVTVYDRDGNAGESLQAPEDVCLYATVDEQDRVYVASVDVDNSSVVIRLYDLDGLNLKERVEFQALNMTLESYWCYLVSLSPGMLVFACNAKLYFIKVSLTGLIVTSSCSANPRVVTVYDRDGNAGEFLQAPEDVYLYATVDE